MTYHNADPYVLLGDPDYRDQADSCILDSKQSAMCTYAYLYSLAIDHTCISSNALHLNLQLIAELEKDCETCDQLCKHSKP